MSSAAEQVFEAGIYAGWAKEDDSTLWRLYLSHYPEDTIYQMTKPGCNIFSHQEGFSVQDVIDIFAGAHLALSLETIGLSQASGLDTQVMYKIFSNAAGSCTQWIDHVPKMKGPKWDLRDVPEAKEILRRLVSYTLANVKNPALTIYPGIRNGESECDRLRHANCRGSAANSQALSSIGLTIERRS